MSERGFQTWFKEQHGKREEAGWRSALWPETDEQLRRMMQAGTDAQHALEMRREWDQRRQSALHAWQVAKKEGEDE